MGERQKPGLGFWNQEFDRRTLFKGAKKVGLGIAAAVIAVEKLDKDGVGFRLNTPEDDPQPFVSNIGDAVPVELAHNVPQMTTAPTVDGAQEIFTENWPSYIEANPEATEGHRWGNGRKAARKGRERGVKIFDIDATYAGGKFYAEHGEVVTIPFIGKPIFVFDWDEKEFRFGGRPDTVDEVVTYIRSIPGASISIEYKRGKSTRGIFEKLLDIIGDMPAKIKVHSFEELKFINSIISKRNLELVTAEIIPDEDKTLAA